MSSQSAQGVKYPAARERPRRTFWVSLFRLAPLLAIAGGLVLLYPQLSVRICAARVEAYYEPQINEATGEVEQFVPRSTADMRSLMQWEQQLRDKPIPRLLALLPSRDATGIWVVSQAIQQQLRQGKLVGWPGKYEPVPPLDAEAAELLLQVADQELPVPATKALVTLLQSVKADAATKLRLARTAQHRAPEVRALGCQLLLSGDLQPDEALEIIELFAGDPDEGVRAAASAALLVVASNSGSQGPSARCQSLLVARLRDEAPAVRRIAVMGLPFLDVMSDEVAGAAAALITDSDAEVQHKAIECVAVAARTKRISALPSRFVDSLCEALVTITPDSDGRLLFYILSIPGLPVAKQWQAIERSLIGPDDGTTPGLQYIRQVLFADEDAFRQSFSTTGSNWKGFRQRFRPFALEAKPRLQEWASQSLEEEDENLAFSGASLLAVMYPHEPDRLTAALSHPSQRVKVLALKVPAPTERQLPILIELMSSRQHEVRIGATRALERFRGSLNSEHTSYFMDLFRNNTDARVLANVFQVLRRLSPADSDLDGLLRESLANKSQWVRDWAACELVARSTTKAEMAPVLLEGIRSGRFAAPTVVAVVDAGGPIESAGDVAMMIELLLCSNSFPVIGENLGVGQGARNDSRFEYVEKLMKLCPAEFAHQALIDGLVRSLATDDVPCRLKIVQLLTESSLKVDQVLSKLEPALQDKRRPVRLGAVLALGAIGARSQDAIDGLIRRLADGEFEVTIAAADALGSIGPNAGSNAAAALAHTARQDKVPGVQAAAVLALGKMGQHIQAHRETLDFLSKHGDPMVRNAASRVLVATVEASRPSK